MGQTTTEVPWQSLAKCGGLPTDEINELFFVGTGGKCKKAKEFCADCPVQDMCLIEAITFNLEGFWSGTNKSERLRMAMFRNIVRKQIPMPEEPEKKKKVFRKVFTSENPYDYLDKIEPTDEELQQLDQAS